MHRNSHVHNVYKYHWILPPLKNRMYILLERVTLEVLHANVHGHGIRASPVCPFRNLL